MKRRAWKMQIDAVKFMRWPYLWEKAGGAGSPEKIYCDFLFNSSWHGYGSVSKHVIILMLVMPNAIYNSCQNNWFGQNNNPLIWYTYTLVGNKVHLQSTFARVFPVHDTSYFYSTTFIWQLVLLTSLRFFYTQNIGSTFKRWWIVK